MSENEWCAYYNRNGLKALEKIVEESSGKYCVGNEITLADCLLIPQVFAANKRYKIDLEEFPTIARIYENLKSLEVFKAAHPLNQPDAPPKNETRFKFLE
ncbi:putative maleylacetoacetate isomerase 2 [Armadillidium nasatum]|uniref:Putative maleylacetoacetate isomerase 2 n=1 Tax=Armadillidium nasatum TaxID=96803 RepID=A0A5N5SQ35_9CRUS|nr:putative maleylacetoacetate isomerase 2 [Armadillidium nasatum]